MKQYSIYKAYTPGMNFGLGDVLVVEGFETDGDSVQECLQNVIPIVSTWLGNEHICNMNDLPARIQDIIVADIRRMVAEQARQDAEAKNVQH